jgi:CRISPR-associated protein Csc2
MSTKVNEIADALKNHGIQADDDYWHELKTWKEFPNQPTERYVHFLFLQEMDGFTVFTQDGQTLMCVKTRDVPNGTEFITRGVEFKRKVVAALRRKSKALLRTYAPETVKVEYKKSKKKEEKTCDILTMCRQCADDSLFGFAVGSGENASNVAFCGKSRVKTDSAFTIRELKKSVINRIDGSGQSADIRIDSPSDSLYKKEYLLPGVVLPVVITIQDPVLEDIAYMLYLIDKTKRYGAESSRGGTVKTTLIGLYFSNEEFLSNKFLSQSLHEKNEKADSLPPVPKLVEMTRNIVDDAIASGVIQAKFVDGTAIMNEVKGTIFSNQASTESWIKMYATTYRDILSELDKHIGS